MTGILQRFSLGVALLLSMGFAQAADTSTAYVNMEQVFEGFYKTKRAEESLRKQENIYKERAETAVGELESMKKKFDQLVKESKSVALSEEAKQKKVEGAKAIEAQLIEKDRELKKYFADKKREMQKEYMTSRNFVVKEILEYVRSYADSKGYELVYDVSGMTQNMLPVILKYPEEKDITDVVLQELNRGQDDLDSADEVPVEEHLDSDKGGDATESKEQFTKAVVEKLSTVDGISAVNSAIEVREGKLTGKIILNAKNIKHVKAVGTIAPETMNQVVSLIVEVTNEFFPSLKLSAPRVESYGTSYSGQCNPEQAVLSNEKCQVLVKVKNSGE